MNLLIAVPVTEEGKFIVAYAGAAVAVYGGVAFIFISALRFLKNLIRRS